MDQPTTVYVGLLDEGTPVWRPVAAESIGRGLYRLVDRNPAGESWAFAPGTVVRCRERIMADDARVLVAVAAGWRLAAGRRAGDTVNMRRRDEHDEADDDEPGRGRPAVSSVRVALIVAHAVVIVAAVGGAIALNVLAKLVR